MAEMVSPEGRSRGHKSRGHKKRERTRRQLVAAGLEVLAERGEGLTVSDVAARAGVSHGTFYNYFPDRDALLDALAEHSLLTLAEEAAAQRREDDAARGFASATASVLGRALADPTWGRAVLRLLDARCAVGRGIHRYLEEDLRSGAATGRFVRGPDAITVDAVVGLLAMTVRRIVRGEAGPDHAEAVIARLLEGLGVERGEAGVLAVWAVGAATASARVA